jgi:hypothetical protein
MALLLLLSNLTTTAQSGTLMDVIANHGQLGQLTAAIRSAGLEGMLRGPGPYTILAPVNGSFGSTSNSGAMRDLVLYHAVKENLSNDVLKGRSAVSSLLGPDLNITNDRGVTINGQAKMVAINIAASNGTLHIINRIVTPPPPPPPPVAPAPAPAAPANDSTSAANVDAPPAASQPETQPDAAPAAYSVAMADPGPSHIADPNQNPAFVSGGLMPYWAGISAESTTCKGMTWVLQNNYGGFSLVGADRKTNPYRGDTSCDQSLPILCFWHDAQVRPIGEFKEGWSFGTIRATQPVQGYQLKTLEAANQLCRQAYGEEWRIAEYHDGANGRAIGPISGHNFWARGNAPSGTRFWVRVNDQSANPWNSVVYRGAPPPANGLRIENPGDDTAFVGFGPTTMSRDQGYATPKTACAGMSWVIYRQLDGKVQVGTDHLTNPFIGDSSCNNALPMLCIRVDAYPVPPGSSGQNYSIGWSGGRVALTRPVTGNEISTREAASNLCTSSFGNGWRMAEFHDGCLGSGGAGWSFWAYGNIPTGQRFWVANNDQWANPWNR